MTYQADYRKAATAAIELLEDYEITDAPVSLKKIIDALSNEIKLITYSEFGRNNRMSLPETIRYMASDLGACAYRPDTCQYIIFYNDTLSKPYCRFTIAHELGHIFLEHHIKAGTSVLARTLIPKKEYAEYEKEANVFARNLLSPAPLADQVLSESLPTYKFLDIQDAFWITNNAATVRVNYVKRDLRDYTVRMIAYSRHIHLLRQRTCEQCRSGIPSGARFCPRCGSSEIRRKSQQEALPAEIPVRTDHDFSFCPRCGNPDISKDAHFCGICGTPLQNICIATRENARTDRRHYNAPYARYCTECGAPTTFYSMGFINTLPKEVEPMFYRDGVEYDEGTMRVNICPRCGNEQFSDKAQFCRICGLDLYNKCEGEEDYNGNLYQHENPSNARYCETCGKPTYFFKVGILKDYAEVVEQYAAEENARKEAAEIAAAADYEAEHDFEYIAEVQSLERDQLGYVMTQSPDDDEAFPAATDEELPFL